MSLANRSCTHNRRAGRGLMEKEGADSGNCHSDPDSLSRRVHRTALQSHTKCLSRHRTRLTFGDHTAKKFTFQRSVFSECTVH